MLAQQVVEVDRAVVQLLRIQLGRIDTRDDAQGATSASQRHNEALTAVLGRKLTQVVGSLAQAGASHTQREDYGIAFKGLGTGQVDHAERLLAGGKERGELRVQAQSVTYRFGHALSVLGAGRHDRKGTVRGAVGMLQNQVRDALDLHTG